MKYSFPLMLACAFVHASAQTPDWSTSVASIIYENCSSCHHEGGIGPMPLMSYDDAAANAVTIQAYVTSKKMPPWPADNNCSYPMLGNRTLSDEEINTINEWVNGGLPAGDPDLAPSPPVINNGSQINGIDHVVELPHYEVQIPTDEYRTFVIPSNYATAQYVNEIEVIPGNNAIVHHVIVYYDPTSAAADKDALDSLPGFSTKGTDVPTISSIQIGGWVPGTVPEKLPSNMAFEIPANADFVVEVHYAPGSQGLMDSTIVNLKYSTEPAPRLVRIEPILFHYSPSINTGLYIPANTIKTFYEKSVKFLYDGDYSLLSVLPHCHLIGKSWEVYMTSPDNSDTTQLLCIPNWDFHWQLNYKFQNLIRWNSHDGYTLRAEATYDNTSNNPENPNNPPIDIGLGQNTTDEMMVVFFSFLDYQEGDEEVILTGIQDPPGTAEILQVYPNPATDAVQVSGWLEADRNLKLNLYNISGSLVSEKSFANLAAGKYSENIDVSELMPGVYILELRTTSARQVTKLVKL